MVLELRGRPQMRRLRRVRTSQRGSVLALLKAAFVRGRANQGGTTARDALVLEADRFKGFFVLSPPEREY